MCDLGSQGSDLTTHARQKDGLEHAHDSDGNAPA